MDLPGSKYRSDTPNSGSRYPSERPLPAVPGPGVATDNGTAVGAARLSTHEHVDMSDIYHEDGVGEGLEFNLRVADGSLLDIYPSRSSSSLSVYGPESSMRSPYLEGVSNDAPRPSFPINDRPTVQGEQVESLRASPSEGLHPASGPGPVSLREFLGSAQSIPNLSDPAGSSAQSRSGNASNPTSTGNSTTIRSGERVGSRIPRTPTRTTIMSRLHDDSSSDGSGDSPLLSHTSPSQISHRQPAISPTEFVLPRWQPDAEVTYCPICRTQFSFFVRKHHCRKCGRVVCNSCSPHRITIPYQYIVQPPAEGISPTSSDPHPRPRTDTSSSLEVVGLGGGERVRLCNPCVPDPNTTPPANAQQPPPYQTRHSRSSSTTAVPGNAPSRETTGWAALNEHTARGANEPLQYPRRLQLPGVLGDPTFYAPSQIQTSRNRRIERGEGLLVPDDFQIRSRSSTVGSSREQTLSPYPSSSNTHTSLSRSNSVRGHPQHRSLLQTDPRMNPQHPSQPPRRRIPEEDLCPVCHRELPARDLADFERVREAHIESCIEAALQGLSISRTSAANTTSTSRNLGATQAAGPSSQGLQGLASSSSTPIPTANMSQAHVATASPSLPSPSPRRLNGGMIFPYTATEKDLIQDAECTICIDDFMVGQEMGRLECFCRFHLKCIRDWFGRKPGCCPLHDQPDLKG